MKHFFILLDVLLVSVEPYGNENIYHWGDVNLFRDESTVAPTESTTTTTTKSTDATRPNSTTIWTTTRKWVNLTMPRSMELFYKQLGKWNGMQPAPGYEPYWEGHQWIYKNGNPKKSRNHTKSTAFTKPYTGMCGKDCPLRYQKYGEICARNRKNVFQSFTNLCFMKNADCFGKIGWTLMYQGNCTSDLLPIFPTVTIHQHALELMSLLYTTTRMTTPNSQESLTQSIQLPSSETDDPFGKVDGAFGGADRRSGDENDAMEDLS